MTIVNSMVVTFLPPDLISHVLNSITPLYLQRRGEGGYHLAVRANDKEILVIFIGEIVLSCIEKKKDQVPYKKDVTNVRNSFVIISPNP